jgi:ATP-dependent DNA helicase RecG
MSAGAVPDATMDDLDAVQRARLRQFIERNNGERVLLELDDARLDSALGLTVREGATSRPTLTGLLLIGREESLRWLIPTHEIAFQVLDGEEVRLNEFTRAPLIQALEWLETLFKPLNPEQEIQVGPFRVPVPKLDRRAYREALANAVIHRDYSLRGATHVRLEGRDTMVISNAGGLVDGVSLNNLLITEPRPRNPALADACKRIGLVERTGRGVDIIYRGLVRYGRQRPDYSGTDAHSVVLRLNLGKANLAFLKMVLKEEERRRAPLPTDSLIVLSALRERKRLSGDELSGTLQRDHASSLAVLEALAEAGLVQRHGVARGRTYTLSPQVYRELGDEVEYTRQVGFDGLQQEQLVRRHVLEHDRIRRRDVMELCRLDRNQAYRLLSRLTKEGVLIQKGERRFAFYERGENF